MGQGVTKIKRIKKSSQNSHYICWGSIICVLLRVVSHYDLECSVYVRDGFPKKLWIEM